MNQKINVLLLLVIVFSVCNSYPAHIVNLCNLSPKFPKTQAQMTYWSAYMTSYNMWNFMKWADPSSVLQQNFIDVEQVIRASGGTTTLAAGMKKIMNNCSVFFGTTQTDPAVTAGIMSVIMPDGGDIVPLYSYETSDKVANTGDYASVISVMPSSADIAQRCLVYFVSQKWRKIGLITTIETEANDFTVNLQKYAGDYNITILTSVLIPSTVASSDKSELVDEPMKIVKNSEALINLFILPTTMSVKTLKSAKRLGVYGTEGVQFILGEQMDRRFDLIEADNSTKDMVSGMISFTTANISNAKYQELKNLWTAYNLINPATAGLELAPAHLYQATAYRINKVLSEIYYNCSDFVKAQNNSDFVRMQNNSDFVNAQNNSDFASAANETIIIPSDITLGSPVNCTNVIRKTLRAFIINAAKNIKCNRYLDVALINGRNLGMFAVNNHVGVKNSHVSAIVDNEKRIIRNDPANDLYMTGSSAIPPDTTERTLVEQSYKMRLGTLVIASIFGAVVLCSAILVYANRNITVVRTSAYRFLILAHIGALIGLIASVIIVQNPTVELCAARWWLVNIAFDLLFGTLFVKSYRIHRLFNNQIFEKIALKDFELMLYLGVALSIDVVLGIFHHAFSAYEIQITDTMIDPKRNFYMSCESDSEVWFIGIPLGLKGILLIIGTVIAVEIRNVKEDFNESKMLAIAIGGTAVISALIIGILFALERQPLIQMPAAAWSYMGVSVGIIALIIVPKFSSMMHHTFSPAGKAHRAKKQPLKLLPPGKIEDGLREIAKAIAHGGYSSDELSSFGRENNAVVKALGNTCMKTTGSANSPRDSSAPQSSRDMSAPQSPRTSNVPSGMHGATCSGVATMFAVEKPLSPLSISILSDANKPSIISTSSHSVSATETDKVSVVSDAGNTADAVVITTNNAATSTVGFISEKNIELTEIKSN